MIVREKNRRSLNYTTNSFYAKTSVAFEYCDPLKKLNKRLQNERRKVFKSRCTNPTLNTNLKLTDRELFDKFNRIQKFILRKQNVQFQAQYFVQKGGGVKFHWLINFFFFINFL